MEHDKSVQINYDEEGKIKFPILVKGILTIQSLGKIVENPSFHSEKYIWPVEFTSYREYISSIDPLKRTKYLCTINSSPDMKAPIFRVVAEDDPSIVAEAANASQAWKIILNHINKSRSQMSKRSNVSGPEFFGFGHHKIAQLIASLPNAEKCTKYYLFSSKNSTQINNTQQSEKTQ